MKHRILILVAGACWGLTGFFNRFITPLGFSQEQIFFARCIIPTVLLGLYLVVFDRGAFRFKLRDIWVFLGSGLLSLTMFGLAYLNAMQHMSLSLAVVFLYTAPIFVMLLSAVFFKEKITRAKIVALVCVIAGVMLASGVFSGQLSTTVLGVVLGLISGIGYALYSIFGRFGLEKGYSSNTVTFYTFLFGSIASGAVSNVPAMVPLITSPQVAGLLLAFGIVCCLVPYLCYTKGLEGVENGVASILATMEVVVATGVSVLFFHEPFGILGLIGVLLLFAGIIVMNVRRAQ